MRGRVRPESEPIEGRETKAKNDKTAQQVKIELIREAMEQCAEDGVEPTRVNVLERIGEVEFRGKPFDMNALIYATSEKAKWSPFRVKKDTNLLYDKSNQALDFDGEIDLSE